MRLTTLAERYGIPADEAVTDVDWLRDAGTRGEVVFLKDERVRYNTTEKAAVREHGVRAFCLSRGDLTAEAMVSLFIAHLDAITLVCRDDPSLFILNQSGLRRIDLG